MSKRDGKFHPSSIRSYQVQRVLRYMLKRHKWGGAYLVEIIRWTGVISVSQIFSSLKRAGIRHDHFYDGKTKAGGMRSRYVLRDLAKAKAAIIN